jgi:hypothetical protein
MLEGKALQPKEDVEKSLMQGSSFSGLGIVPEPKLKIILQE